MEDLLKGGSEPLKPKVIKRGVLLRAGLDFRYMTHRHTTRNGHTYYFCYEYGYREMDRDDYMVVRDEKAVPEKEK
jgi:YHS domain-containing protein